MDLFPKALLAQIIETHEREGLALNGTDTPNSEIILSVMSDHGLCQASEEQEEGSYEPEAFAESAVEKYIGLREKGVDASRAQADTLDSHAHKEVGTGEKTVSIPFRLLEYMTEASEELLTRDEHRHGTTKKNTRHVEWLRSIISEGRSIIEKTEGT